MKNIAITYKIEKSSSWRSEKGFDIKSNLADDKLIECQLAKSLVDELKEKSVMLEPDKLLLSFAEAQKRGIQDNLEALNDFDLAAKNYASSIHEKLLKTEEDFEVKYTELQEKFVTITNKFESEILKTTKKLTAQVELINNFETTLNKVDTHSMDSIATTMEKVLTLLKKDPELVNIIFKHKLK